VVKKKNGGRKMLRRLLNKNKTIGIEGVEGVECLNSLTDKQKKWIIKRDNHKCQSPECKKGSDIIIVSHIIQPDLAHNLGWTENEINGPENIIVLCEDCYNAVKNAEENHCEIVAEKKKSYHYDPILERTLHVIARQNTHNFNKDFPVEC